MVRIAVFGDTHVPSRADGIPEWVREEVAEADHAIHTGDFDSAAAFETVADLAGDSLTAVAGNTDPPLELPAVAVLEREGVTFVVTHGTGELDGYEQRVTGIARQKGGDEVIAIAGHTHEVIDTEVDGIRLLNPGSATGAGPATTETMFTLDVADGTLDVTRHER